MAKGDSTSMRGSTNPLSNTSFSGGVGNMGGSFGGGPTSFSPGGGSFGNPTIQRGTVNLSGSLGRGGMGPYSNDFSWWVPQWMKNNPGQSPIQRNPNIGGGFGHNGMNPGEGMAFIPERNMPRLPSGSMIQPPMQGGMGPSMDWSQLLQQLMGNPMMSNNQLRLLPSMGGQTGGASNTGLTT